MGCALGSKEKIYFREIDLFFLSNFRFCLIQIANVKSAFDSKKDIN